MKGFHIGHCENEYTGVTVVLAPEGATAGVSVRGGAPGTRETDLLKSENTVQKIHAVALCGGSAFGLDAAGGVMEYLYEKGCGFKTAGQNVPIVCGAVLYDLRPDFLAFPDKTMGKKACENARENNTEIGKIGAGKGATTGKILGKAGIDSGGIGYAELEVGGAQIAAIIALNALGDVYDIENGKIVAGARLSDGSFLDTERAILSGLIGQKSMKNSQGTNTTIGVIFTNAAMSKTEANKLAEIAHDGLAKSIKPVHTTMDGDTLFAMASGEVALEFNTLCVAAVEVVRRAVLRAVSK